MGNSELITWPTGNNASYSVTIDMNDETHKLKLLEALYEEELSLAVVGVAPGADYYVIPANVPANDYSYGYEITVYDISWDVDLDAPKPIVGTYAVVPGTPDVGDQSGTVAAVPYHCTAAKLILAE